MTNQIAANTNLSDVQVTAYCNIFRCEDGPSRTKSLARALQADGSFSVKALADFEKKTSHERMLILARVRSSGFERNQKHLPVVTSLLIFVLGIFSSVVGEFATDASVGPWGYAIVPVFLLAVLLLVNFVGPKDAKREANYASWLKAMEEADARA